MDYGKTLHLPETEFPMRGNLPKREPEILKFWEDNKIYEKRLELRKDAKPFILHDGPPYANGKLHIGHASTKTLKGHHHEIQDYDRSLYALYPRLGYAWFANRACGYQKHRS